MSNVAAETIPAEGAATGRPTAPPFAAAIDAVIPKLTSGLKPVLLLVGIAAAVAVGISVVLWARGANYSLLYANLPADEQAAITQALTAAGIPNKLNADGSGILVPQERLGEARLKLAGQGLPENNDGFAIMTRDPGLGVSQFVEDARYQHAMESELAHTISSLQPVEGARVHIAASRQSPFVRDRHPASASVFVQLKPGRRLEQEQIRAIVNLVASSVPEMDAGQITLVDQHGHLLNSPGEANDPAARTDEQLREVQRIEDDYQQRVESILTPILGAGRVHAQVVAQLDTSTSEQAREEYKPDSQIVRSEQSSEQVSHDQGPMGVPGALTNQPPAAGAAQPPSANRAPAPVAGAAGGQTGLPAAQSAEGSAPAAPPADVSKQSTRNYEIDRTVDYTQQPAGRIKRLTVAVVVDDMHSVDKGKPSHHPLSQPQIDHMTGLVKDAVGFDESRGDSVSVVNASFQDDESAAPEPKIPFWETGWFRDIARLGIGALVLLALALGVLRPLVRGLIDPPKPAALAGPAAEPTLAAPDLKPDSVHIGSLETPAIEADPAAEQARRLTEAYEKKLTGARALVGQDPKLVAQIVHTWVNDDE